LAKKAVHDRDISDLLQVACDLTELYELITLMKDNEKVREEFEVQVKGKGKDLVLLPTLKKCHAILDDFDPEGEIFVPIHDEFDDCVTYLDENYSIKSKVWKQPETLRDEDLEKLSDWLDSIIRTLVGYSDNLTDSPSVAKGLRKISKLAKDLDKKTKADLKEAMEALEFGLTTAAFMLFCRVGETLARTYYEKITNNNSKDKIWNDMYKEIKDKQYRENNVNYTVLDLFGFLKQKRNKALHPGERFDEDDCEKLLHYIDDFHKEISKH